MFIRIRRMVIWVLGILILGSAAVYFAGCYLYSVPGYSGPPSDHFYGGKFHNRYLGHKGFKALVKWSLTRDRGRWREWIEDTSGPPPPERIGRGELRVTFINHATVLIQMDSLNILTDPIWSDRASPLNWAGPKRHRPPGLRFEGPPCH